MDSIEKQLSDPRWKKAADTFDSGDHAGALFLLRSMVNDGLGVAYSRIGYMYEYGLGVERNNEKAYEWYQRGYNEVRDSVSIIGLARLNISGFGIKHDYRKAFQYLNEAKGFRSAEVYSMLGFLYHTGNGVVRDLKKAKTMYLRAVAKGDKGALVYVWSIIGKSGHPIKGFCMQFYWLLRMILRNIWEVGQSKK